MDNPKQKKAPGGCLSLEGCREHPASLAARLFRAFRLTSSDWRKLARTVCLLGHSGSLFGPFAPREATLGD
jgi:hypothetical protein